MSNVLLILDDGFVSLPDAESVIINKRSELVLRHTNAQVDQFLLSNIILNNVELQPNHYDSIYYLDASRDFNQMIPNNSKIKQALKTTTSLSLGKTHTTKVGSKLSGLKKFKKLNKQTTSALPYPSTAGVGIDSPTPLATPSPLVDTAKKLRYLDDLSNSSSEDDDDDELIDENELIGENSLLSTSSIICLNEPAGNGVKRRKACKDCTCGLAEKEAFQNNIEKEETELKAKHKQAPKIQFSEEELTEIDFTIQGKTGGCGSCSLGDAFRCAGCPFLGLPAFKPGQAITLDGVADDL